MKRTSLGPLALCLLALALLPPLGGAPAGAATGPGSIAYVRPATGQGTEIRIVEPDGSGDRLVTAVADSPAGNLPTLAWRPDARELAFASDHGAPTSLYEKDIYAVRPDGRGLRKLTNGPVPGQLAAYPKGTVTVDVILASNAGPALVYVAGAAEPLTALSSGRLTFSDVADFGPGAVQGVVGIIGPLRWYGAAVDVQAGAGAHAGTLRITGAGVPRRADRPVWRADGAAIGFMVGEYCGEFRRLATDPPVNSGGETVLQAASFLGFLCLVDWGPTAALADQLLYNEWDPGVRGIYRKAEGSAGAGELLLTYDVFHMPLDLRWLPDGSGFVIALAEWEGGRWASSNLYEFSLADRELRPITSFDDELAGAFSIAPDGQWIVFERAPDTEQMTDLWVVHRDGSELRLLTENAARPAWSHLPPQAAPVYNAYLPALRR
jgi:hypothetical protein